MITLEIHPEEPERPANQTDKPERVARAQKIISRPPLFFSILLAGCSESSSSEAADESKPEAYPQGYVEDFDEPRTKLADFINSLLDRILKDRLRSNRLSQNSTTLEFVENPTSGRIEVCRA